MTTAVELRPAFLPARDERDSAWRDHPAPDQVERLRAAYPTEREYDAMLTRKMLRRAQPAAKVPTLEQLGAALDSFLRDHVDGSFTVTELRWLSGGASKIQVAFSLDWDDPVEGRTRSRLVLRMEPTESLNSTSRRRELQLLAAMSGVVPVPRTYWLDAQGSWFPEPTIVYAFADGVIKPSAIRGRVSGTGNPFDPELRASLGAQFTEALARIHTADVSGADLSAFDLPAVGTTQSPLWQLNRARRVWEEDRPEDFPVIEVVANWLEDHLPPVDQVSVVHGDFRAGNFLFDEERREITAWLDWERGHLGDRHRDLAWSTLPVFGNYTADGHTLLVSGLVPYEGFLERYQELSGLEVDPVRLHFYRVFAAYQLVVSNLASSYRVVRLGRSHQDILLAWIEGVSYPFAHEMLRMIEEGPA